MSLEEPLIQKRESNDNFGVGVEDLARLFEKENRTSDHGGVCESSAKLYKLGGAEGLLKALDSRDNYGIDDSEEGNERRVKAYGNNERRPIKTRGI
jgi:hypothetical protein